MERAGNWRSGFDTVLDWRLVHVIFHGKELGLVSEWLSSWLDRGIVFGFRHAVCPERSKTLRIYDWAHGLYWIWDSTR
jgi:hypothetical protein